MKAVLLLIFLSLPISGFAALSHENVSDREIFSEGLKVASKLLKKDSQSAGGTTLLTFLKWMDSSNKIVKDMNASLNFSEPIKAQPGGSEEAL